jgi:hypothetical protein
MEILLENSEMMAFLGKDPAGCKIFVVNKKKKFYIFQL